MCCLYSIKVRKCWICFSKLILDFILSEKLNDVWITLVNFTKAKLSKCWKKYFHIMSSAMSCWKSWQNNWQDLLLASLRDLFNSDKFEEVTLVLRSILKCQRWVNRIIMMDKIKLLLPVVKFSLCVIISSVCGHIFEMRLCLRMPCCYTFPVCGC